MNTTNTNSFAIGVYLDELIFQCESALYCFNEMNKYVEVAFRNNPISKLLSIKKEEITAEISEQATDDWNKYQIKVFQYLEYLLKHVSSISKLLWPISKESKNRGLLLRGVIGVNEGSLIKNRELRDHIEHFDERLDEILKNKIEFYSFISLNYADNLPRKNAMSFRQFNAKTGDVSCLSRNAKEVEKYNINKIVDEIKRIYQKAKKAKNLI